jgi:hypothetical protein
VFYLYVFEYSSFTVLMERDYWIFKNVYMYVYRSIHTRGGMYIHVNWSRAFIVRIESRLQSWGLGFEYRQGQGVFVFSTTWRPYLGSFKLSLQWKLRFILWGKAAGSWICHSPPPSSEVKNEWSYSFTPSVCLHGMDKNNFTLFYKGDWGYIWVP